MATPVWQPGTIYAPGALVQPASAIAPVAATVVNGGFESGDTAWTKDAGWTIGQFGAGTHFQGTWSAQWDATSTGRIRATAAFDVQPGQSITASCQVQQGSSSSGDAGARVEIGWYTAADALISYSSGNMVDSGSNQNWKPSTVTGVAPPTAAKARIVGYAFRTAGGAELWVDNFTWNLQVTELPTGLVFKATQATAGYSAATEPVWPVVLGGTVVDNEVTWEGVYASRVVWEASPILVSGASEPAFPTLAGATVADNTIIWTAMRANVVEAPNSRIVAIAVSKIFAADGDITPFSATVNCLDWTTANDAGYIPNGLNTYGGTDTTALGLYRSNLVIFNEQGYQMWQVDQDPANMAILDASPIPCAYPDSVTPVSNDLVFLTSRGVRSIGIAGASTNLQAGYFGQAVDPLVLAAIKAGTYEPFGIFYPGAGQYWLFFGNEAFVLTMEGKPTDASWSRYVFPSAVTDWTILGDDLYLRTGDLVWKVDDESLVDDEGGTDVEFGGYMAWPYLDFGVIGDDKELESVELVVNGEVDISIGWDQRKGQEASATTPYETTGDTVNGTPIPIPLTAPSLQVRLTLRPTPAVGGDLCAGVGGPWFSGNVCVQDYPPANFNDGVYAFNSIQTTSEQTVQYDFSESLPLELSFPYEITEAATPGPLYLWWSDEFQMTNPTYVELTGSSGTIEVTRGDTGFFAWGITTESSGGGTGMASGEAEVSCESEPAQPWEWFATKLALL